MSSLHCIDPYADGDYEELDNVVRKKIEVKPMTIIRPKNLTLTYWLSIFLKF